jgi:hypothetical protein
MNERIKQLLAQAHLDADNIKDTNWIANRFAELIIQECAQLARDTDLEDVEGGDSAVLRAAKRQILEHFGVSE